MLAIPHHSGRAVLHLRVMVGDQRQGWAILIAMTLIFVVLLGVCVVAERRGIRSSPSTASIQRERHRRPEATWRARRSASAW